MKKQNKKGFTIVELVIVIAIIAILAAVLIPTYSSVTTKAKKSAALQEAKAAQTLVVSELGTNFSNQDMYFYSNAVSGGVWFKYDGAAGTFEEVAASAVTGLANATHVFTRTGAAFTVTIASGSVTVAEAAATATATSVSGADDATVATNADISARIVAFVVPHA